MIKKLLIFLLLGFIFPINVFASDQFKSSINITYNYDDNGVPTVRQDISLKNLTSENYVSSYQFVVYGEKPNNISGRDSLGPLKINTAAQALDATQVTVNFNQQAVGVGKTLKFYIEYTGQTAKKTGQVWQISIPALSDTHLFEDYQLTINVPPSFGPAASLSPPPQHREGYSYTYTAPPEPGSLIQGAFGNFQSFDFHFTYSLDNFSSRRQTLHIPLPTDTSYQHVVFTGLTPLPNNVISDEYENWLAEYSLPPGQRLTVILSGQVYIQPEPIFSSLPESDSNLELYKQLSGAEHQRYPDLAGLSQKYTSPSQILEYMSSSGQTSADLFVAMAKAVGIPARLVRGYIYPGKTLVSWAEYWNSQDQDWVNTDFDVNHLSFFIDSSSVLGIDPPIVDITPAPYLNPQPVSPEFVWQKPFQFLPLSKNKTFLEIFNKSGQAVYQLPISVAAQNITLEPPTSFNLPLLLPYSHYSFPVIFSASFLPDFSSKYLSVSVDNRQMTYNVSNNLFLLWHVSITSLLTLFIIGMALFTVKAWGLYLQGLRKKYYLRRKSQKSSSAGK